MTQSINIRFRSYIVHMASHRLFQFSIEITVQPRFNKRTCGGQIYSFGNSFMVTSITSKLKEIRK